MNTGTELIIYKLIYFLYLYLYFVLFYLLYYIILFIILTRARTHVKNIIYEHNLNNLYEIFLRGMFSFQKKNKKKKLKIFAKIDSL